MLLAAIYLFAVNLLTVAAFAIDKRRAERGRRRTPEADLLFLAFAGGSPGAWAAMRLFRHKSAKRAFQRRLMRVTLLQGLIAVGAVGWLYAT
jgi:uncharacterized membrane protein YsdA (DUF1294 family)